MFKHKVSIYLESGNVLYWRLTPSENKNLMIFFHNLEEEKYTENFTFLHGDLQIKNERIEAIIFKNWWQKWG